MVSAMAGAMAAPLPAPPAAWSGFVLLATTFPLVLGARPDKGNDACVKDTIRTAVFGRRMAAMLRQSPALRPFGLAFVPYAGMTRIRFSGLTRFASLSRSRHPNEFCGTIGGKDGDVKRPLT